MTIAYTSIDGKDYRNKTRNEGVTLINAHAKTTPTALTNPYAIDAKVGSFGEYTTLLKNYFDPHSEAMYKASKKLYQESDLVIGHAVCHTLLTASEKFNCPWISLVLTHLVVRSNYASPIGLQLGSLIHSFLWTVGEKVAIKSWLKEAKKIRKREGLPPVKAYKRNCLHLRY